MTSPFSAGQPVLREKLQPKNLHQTKTTATHVVKAVRPVSLCLCGYKYNFQSYTKVLFLLLLAPVSLDVSTSLVYGAHFCFWSVCCCQPVAAGRREPLYCSLFFFLFSFPPFLPSSYAFPRHFSGDASSHFGSVFRAQQCALSVLSIQSVVARLVECFQPLPALSPTSILLRLFHLVVRHHQATRNKKKKYIKQNWIKSGRLFTIRMATTGLVTAALIYDGPDGRDNFVII